jgi:pimeloyl-ACP methyl ester carboxylesterase
MRKLTAMILFVSLLLASQAKVENLQSQNEPLNMHFQAGPANKDCGDSLFSNMVTPLGYPFSSYTTTTDDGYVLKLFRMQAKNTKMSSGKPVVFLQHGILDSADDWVVNTEPYSLGFVLANQGYDVWFGNSRGNKYSKLNNHISPLRREFWDYSFQEMGQYDVKANIAFVLAFTGQAKLTYVGHSQGTSQMFAALGDPATAPLINSKVSKFIALAPVVYCSNFSNKFFWRLAHSTILIDAAETFGIDQWLPGACSTSSAQSEFEKFVCELDPIMCDWVISLLDYNPKYDNEKRMPFFVQHNPSGTSLRCLLHYRQLMAAPKHAPVFQKYDFGTRENEKKYGQKQPPMYDFSNINIPVRGFVGLDDSLGDPTDNDYLTNTLKTNLKKDYKEYIYNNCGHMTFMWGLNPTPMFTDILAEIASAQ